MDFALNYLSKGICFLFYWLFFTIARVSVYDLLYAIAHPKRMKINAMLKS